MMNFGMRQAVAIRVRLDQREQLVESRIVDAVHHPVRHVIADRRRPEAVGAIVVDHRRLQVEHVDHRRHDRDDAAVHGRGRPRRPATLGTAGDDELRDRAPATLGRLGVRLHRVHGADGSLGHREARQPLLVAAIEELAPAIGDEVVFLARDAVLEERQRLVRDHPQFGDDRLRAGGNGREHGVGLRWRGAVVGAASDEQQRRVALDVSGRMTVR